jgi:hypothetical protein
MYDTLDTGTCTIKSCDTLRCTSFLSLKVDAILKTGIVTNGTVIITDIRKMCEQYPIDTSISCIMFPYDTPNMFMSEFTPPSKYIDSSTLTFVRNSIIIGVIVITLLLFILIYLTELTIMIKTYPWRFILISVIIGLAGVLLILFVYRAPRIKSIIDNVDSGACYIDDIVRYGNINYFNTTASLKSGVYIRSGCESNIPSDGPCYLYNSSPTTLWYEPPDFNSNENIYGSVSDIDTLSTIIIVLSLFSLVFITSWILSCVNRSRDTDATENRMPINDIPLTDINTHDDQPDEINRRLNSLLTSEQTNGLDQHNSMDGV